MRGGSLLLRLRSKTGCKTSEAGKGTSPDSRHLLTGAATSMQW